MKLLAQALLLFYRGVLSGHIGGSCRFEPSCSEYAVECFEKHKVSTAFSLTARRLLKCHPLSQTFGFDPVPSLKDVKYAKAAK